MKGGRTIDGKKLTSGTKKISSYSGYGGDWAGGKLLKSWIRIYSTRCHTMHFVVHIGIAPAVLF